MPLVGFQMNSSAFVVDLLEASHKRIEYWAKIRGSEMPMTLEAYKNMYGINDMMLKDRSKARRTMVQMISDFASNAALHNHCLKSLERKGKCYRYVFEHYNRMITSYLNMYFPYVAATHGAGKQISLNKA